MKVIFKPRGMGKTTDLITYANDLAGCHYIVVPTERQARHVAELAKEMKANIQFPLTFDELTRGAYVGRNIDSFLIDNADELLRMSCVGVRLSAVTLTDDGS